MRSIDADALMDYLQTIPIDLGYRGIEDVKRFVNKMPTIEERKKGKWVKPLLIMNTDRVRCSECSAMYDWYTQAQYFNFCPNCGKRMEN